RTPAFRDVPRHDRLGGNMLVGAGEIDAAMLVVAVDDGPRAQTLEHLALLDALGVHRGLGALQKVDTADGAAAPPRGAPPAQLAIDRAFSVKGRGVVVTGSLRGGPLSRGDRLRLVPDPA